MTSAVVILNYNGASLLPIYLPSVLEFTPESIDIFIIDNASTDQSIEIIEGISNRIKIIKLKENHGFAGGYNIGLAQISSDIFILLNSDVEVTNDWTEPILSLFSSNQDIGATVPKIRSSTQRECFEHAGASGGYLDKYGYAFCRGRILDCIEKDHGQYDDEKSVAWGSGCALAVRSSVFNGIGGFDSHFFAHYEEIDLCWRIRRSGYRIVCVPSSIIFHLGGGTLDYVSPQKLYLNFRNSLFTLYKNKKGWDCFKTLFIRLILDGVAGFVYLFKGQISSIGAIIKAHYKFYVQIGKLKKRSQAEEDLINSIKIGQPNTDGQYNQSILWNYFVQKKKTFNQLTGL